MSNKSSNIYQQIIDMELHDLENKMVDLQNTLTSQCAILDEMWAYHPANPDGINLLKAYSEVKKSINNIEQQIDDLELKIQTLKSTN
jgi:hypothetical protein